MSIKIERATEMKYYYAALTIEDLPHYIALFDTPEERDRWVNYEDEESALLGLKGNEGDISRAFISEEEAAEITDNHIYYPEFIVADDFDPDFKWVETEYSIEWEW